MKKYLIILIAALLSLPAFAQIGVQYDMAYKQFASSFTFMDFVLHMPASGQCVNMLNADLTAKAPICANMGTGISFDSSTNTLNVAAGPVINRARITTASDGTYTWTYPIACPAATVPVLQMTPEGSAGVTYNTVIVGTPTNTAANIKITQVTDIVLLTIHVLGVAPASATVVHLTAICP